MQTRFASRQRGFALLEALIAALLVAAGAIALIWLQGELRYNADTARQRTEAARLAQADIEQLRAFVAVDADSGSPAWSEIADDVLEHAARPRHQPDALHADAQRADERGDELKTVNVTLRWTDRREQPQQLSLGTLIAGHDPALAGALMLAHPPLARP